jgi:hypothetical protein
LFLFLFFSSLDILLKLVYFSQYLIFSSVIFLSFDSVLDDL